MISAFAEAMGHKLRYVCDGETGLPIFLVYGVPSASFRWRPVHTRP
jgi:pimeloyl-ACP methyl ester carboxylesterase